MSCEVTTLEGTKISIGTAVEVADCSKKLAIGDYANVNDWTVIGAAEKFTIDGEEWEIIDNKLLDGNIAKSKGADKTGKVDIDIVYADGDTGQGKLKEAERSKNNYALKFEYGNGKVAYTQGLVTKLSMPSGGTDDLMKRQVTVELTQKVVSDL